MIIPIRFNYITLRGKTSKIDIDLEFPNFEVKKVNTPYGIGEISINEQVMEHLDNMDKSSIMDKFDMGVILDYELVSEIPTLSDYIKGFGLSEQLTIDLVACYGRLHDVIDDLEPSKQLLILLRSIGVGYEAKTDAYIGILNILRSNKDKKVIGDVKLLS